MLKVLYKRYNCIVILYDMFIDSHINYTMYIDNDNDNVLITNLAQRKNTIVTFAEMHNEKVHNIITRVFEAIGHN